MKNPKLGCIGGAAVLVLAIVGLRAAMSSLNDLRDDGPPEVAVPAPVVAAPTSVTIVDSSARLCSTFRRSACGEELGRVPVGATLAVEDHHVVTGGGVDVTWFQVTSEGTTGWVSEFTTDAAVLE